MPEIKPTIPKEAILIAKSDFWEKTRPIIVIGIEKSMTNSE